MAGWLDAKGWPSIVKYAGVRIHFIAAVSVLAVSIARAALWQWGRPEQKSYLLRLIGSAVLLNLLIAVTGWLGGKLVYGS